MYGCLGIKPYPYDPIELTGIEAATDFTKEADLATADVSGSDYLNQIPYPYPTVGPYPTLPVSVNYQILCRKYCPIKYGFEPYPISDISQYDDDFS